MTFFLMIIIYETEQRIILMVYCMHSHIRSFNCCYICIIIFCEQQMLLAFCIGNHVSNVNVLVELSF
jgi:hypothetical protein